MLFFPRAEQGLRAESPRKNPRVKESSKEGRKETGRVSIYTYMKVDWEGNNNKRPPLITSDCATSPQRDLHDYYNTSHPLDVH